MTTIATATTAQTIAIRTTRYISAAAQILTSRQVARTIRTAYYGTLNAIATAWNFATSPEAFAFYAKTYKAATRFTIAAIEFTVTAIATITLATSFILGLNDWLKGQDYDEPLPTFDMLPDPWEAWESETEELAESVAPTHPIAPAIVEPAFIRLLGPARETAPVQPAIDLASLGVHKLREICTERDIKWNRTGKNGKHLTKTEMIQRLTA